MRVYQFRHIRADDQCNQAESGSRREAIRVGSRESVTNRHQPSPTATRSHDCNRDWPSGGLSLENEIRLAKPALLYADSVTLISPVATLLQPPQT